MSTFNNLQNQAYSQMSNTLESSIEGDFGFYGSQSGLDLNMDVDSSSNLPAYFYPNGNAGNEDFVNPSAIESRDERVRVWPGMHQQQAALAKAQAQAQQQRQQQMMQQQQQKQHQTPTPQQHSAHKRNGSQTDPRTEDMIQRVVNQIRQNSNAGDRSMSPPGLLPHVVRMKKDEEDMDEDERLLASDEGKKLSSKERRQLRNKVSARAFRSRRKGKLPISNSLKNSG